uniref:AAA+ ATPase domain-containing protein n=1 Tax=Myotis lucifugus TaxID=59463 RepID=G1PMK1_MYOLU
YNHNLDLVSSHLSCSLAFIKRTPVIDADKPVSSQLRILTLSEDSPYETLHSFISNAVAPFFKSYIRESGKADRDGDKMAPSVEKKIAELEMGLLHLQQNIEIPEISLPIHPIITNVAKQCYERGEKPKVTDFGDKVEDPTFLNQLQSGVNRWIREIQKVTKLDRDPASGTALQEISFWLNLERALYRIQEKRESPEVLLTLDILKHGKRFHATVSFDTDTGLKQALETVNDYNPLMKDFPLNDLLSATELDKIRQALVAIFTHLRKIRNTKYPIQRALRLVEAISRDLSSQLLKVLGTRKLMHVAYEEFEKVMVACFEVFQTWDDEYEKLQVLLRDIVKRKREENLKMVWRINPAHRKLQARLDQMRKFRRQHEQLRAVIVRVLRPQVTAVAQQNQGEVPEPQDMKVAEVLFDAADANAIEEVNLAYENVKEVDGLDVSKEGTEAWEAAMKRYDERIDRVETRITARLRDQLGTAKNANEMFRIFSRFNALFVRPHIRGAIREYQTQLIQRVKDDIESLHDKFKVQYPQSQACKMSHVRDLPPVSGSIIWAKQIDRQLTAYMKRVEDVLGKGWENHVEGQKLKQDGDSFRMKLNTQEIFDDWARKVQQRNLGVSGRIFTIESTRVRGRSGNVLKLKVNFLPEIITLSKEVRNLKWLGFRVPLAIVNKAHQANQLYPFAISLIESVRTYERTCEKVEERNTISLLVAGLKKEVQALIAEGIALVWESYKLDPYVQRLAETVFNFQEKVDDLLIIEEKIDLEVRSLETCLYDHKTFSEILNRVQKAVDDLNLHSYSNLPIWVNKLDMEVRLGTEWLLTDMELSFPFKKGKSVAVYSHKGRPTEGKLTKPTLLSPLTVSAFLTAALTASQAVLWPRPTFHKDTQASCSQKLTSERRFFSLLVTESGHGPVYGFVHIERKLIRRWQAGWDCQPPRVPPRPATPGAVLQLKGRLWSERGPSSRWGPSAWPVGIRLKPALQHPPRGPRLQESGSWVLTENHCCQVTAAQQLLWWSLRVIATGQPFTYIDYAMPETNVTLCDNNTSTIRKRKWFNFQILSLRRPVFYYIKQYQDLSCISEFVLLSLPHVLATRPSVGQHSWEEALEARLRIEGGGLQKTHCSATLLSLQIERILGVRLQAGLRAWTQVLLGQAEDKSEVDMDTDAPQVSHKPGGEPKIKVSVSQSIPCKPASPMMLCGTVCGVIRGCLAPRISPKSLRCLEGHWHNLCSRAHVQEIISGTERNRQVDVQAMTLTRPCLHMNLSGNCMDESVIAQWSHPGHSLSPSACSHSCDNVGRWSERCTPHRNFLSAVLFYVVCVIISKKGITNQKPKRIASKTLTWGNIWLFFSFPDFIYLLSFFSLNAFLNIMGIYPQSIFFKSERVLRFRKANECVQVIESGGDGAGVPDQLPAPAGGTGRPASVSRSPTANASSCPCCSRLGSGARPSRWCLIEHPGMGDLQEVQPALRLGSLGRAQTASMALQKIMVQRERVMHQNHSVEADRGVRHEIFAFQNVIHELRITNQVIYLNPPIEECRYKLYQEMFAWKMIVLSLPRIQSQRYQVSLLARPPSLCDHLSPVSLNTALGVFSTPGFRPCSLRYFSQSLRLQLRSQWLLESPSMNLGEFYFLLLSPTPTFYYGSLQTSAQVGGKSKGTLYRPLGPAWASRHIPSEQDWCCQACLERSVLLGSVSLSLTLNTDSVFQRFFCRSICPWAHSLGSVGPDVATCTWGERAVGGACPSGLCLEITEDMGLWVLVRTEPARRVSWKHGRVWTVSLLVAKDPSGCWLEDRLGARGPLEAAWHQAEPWGWVGSEGVEIGRWTTRGGCEKGGAEHDRGAWPQQLCPLSRVSVVREGLLSRRPSGFQPGAWATMSRGAHCWRPLPGAVASPRALSAEKLDRNHSFRAYIGKRTLTSRFLPNLHRSTCLVFSLQVRIMFEVQDLKYATLATVSRCGMVWFSEDVLSTDMIFNNFLARLRSIPLDEGEDEAQRRRKGKEDEGEEAASPMLQIQRDAATIMQPYFTSNGLVTKALEHAFKLEHIMDLTRLRCLGSLFSMLHQACRNVAQYNANHPDFPMQIEQLERYIQRYLVYAILWSLSGDSRLKMRAELGEYIRRITTVPLPAAPNIPIIDYEVSISGEWSPWQAKVPQIEVETHKVAAPDVVVPTLDTVRHEALLYTWLAEHKPLVLCGPPGSGKTMTLFSALRALPDMEVVGLNFSSATTPELLLKTFDHYCEYRRTPNGVVLAPVQLGKWLVLFCDEINLPDMDKYGTQRVISFIRQMVEHGGFYRTSDQTWVKLERIQFVGACNPPTDPGRKPLSHRFLRHVPVVYVDYPGPASLTQIYGTFNRAMLRLIPSLRTYAEPLTAAMVEFYTMSQERFTQDTQPHYIYSPREMTRWVRGIFEALRPLETLPVEGLIRIWAHEALRLFQDRLVEDEERRWTDENIDMVALKHFPNIDKERAMPCRYSNVLKEDYIPVDQEELRDYVKARLKVFYEEELDVPLVLFNEVLDHVLRIDRIFRQPQGHLLLIGVSGAGKTTLSRFVAWMNGLSVYQIKVHRKYTGEDFDEDLRTVLRRSGCKNEKIAFIMDESNVLDSGFLERMNTLLANGEVPGLFEGDEYATLMTQCKEGAQKEGLMLDSHEELYKWFTSQVIRNLHVVFTMNPSSEGLKDRAATSPALFNRCVLNWFGDWSTEALYQVGKEFTSKMDLEKPNYIVPDYMPVVYDKLPQPPSHREAIVNSCVFVHQTLHQANARLAKRGGRTMAITPRHYLDFINHYANLFHEKRSELEEQQMHLNVGLRKIKETVDQVEELRRDLRIKSQELEVKNAAANDKLKKMVKDQQEAEKKKVMSQEIQEQLHKQQEVIADKQMSVKEDLDKVEPAVIEAQNAVKSIKKQHLVEVRSMANPPAAVKLALESICLLLGESTTDWKQIRSIIMRENFIPTIVNFSAEEISDAIREKMKKNYMSNPSYNYEIVNRASLACGPMVKWAIAQLNYADMLKRVEPLRNELQKLEDDAKDNQQKANEVEQMIRDLEASIARYKEEYAVLISEAQAIKADLAAVEAKVNRSTALLKSLSAERERWEKTSETFKNQMSTIAGDCLLSAAFIAYAGYFDQQMRQNLFTTWSHHLQQANIQFRTDIARTEYLSNADERLRWQASSLPADDLCTENAIMLKRFNRYPLIIDPSGQATEFIMNEYKDRKITRTSFLDDAFRKNLESALRFGNPLLVQDVESYDPVLNPVLNREVRRTGGRVLITLGDQDIDLSPSFVIFLSTRDPTVEFPPDLCSRVTFVNFTVTRSSLQSQCLNEVLKAERPDVDEKRSDLLKLQGEFQLRLRQLEKSLLQALNEVKGRILDDDTIITTLENLKREAAEVTRKVEETDIVMQEVETVSQQYLPLSTACSSIYFTMESLKQIHFLYQYSLQFFLDIYHNVLYENPNLKGITDHTQRLSIITKDLFQVAFNRVARGMLHQDHITFAMLLARIKLKGTLGEPTYDAEFQHFLRGKEIVLTAGSTPTIQGLTVEQAEAVVRLSCLPAFRDLIAKVQADEQFGIWLDSSSPEQTVPYLWSEESPATPIGQAIHRLLLIQAFRPDRLLAMAHVFVSTNLGESFMSIMEQPLDLTHIVDTEVKPNTPVLMCSVPGYDASGHVEDLAAEQNTQITSIAIGSAEGFNQADKAINTAVKSGRWVMLKNVHLAPGWLMQLEKKLHSLQPHACFRLFLTMEINPKVPVNLLRAGRIFVFEPPPGVKANMLRTFSSIPVARICKSPNERARLYFLLAWFHAIIQERLRYAPLGWSKKYEFGESDLRSACDTVDTWLDDTAKGRQNISPDKIPWSALKTLMAQSIYGGRVDNEFDQRLLNTFLERLFTTKSFDSEFKLACKVDGHKDIQMPDGIRREEFVQWVELLPDTQTPSWLGLPNNAERVLLTTQGVDMISKMLKMQMLEDEDDLAYAETEKKARADSTSDGRPAWMRTLHTTASNWLHLIPQTLSHLKRTVDNIKDPLFRFFEREVKMGAKLLQDVRQDLADVVQVCEGKKKQTNYLRTLINELVKGILPRSWSHYTVPAGMTVIQWVSDFSERIKQLQNISLAAASGGAKELKNIHVCLGGLFVPEAYITATRQYVAQANSWSLEELCLEVNVTTSQNTTLDACSFGVTGLKLQGAMCSNNKLSLSNAISTVLPLTQLRWVKQTNAEKKANVVTLPVYLNFTRADLIFTVDFEIATKEDPRSFYERGVAVLCTE